MDAGELTGRWTAAWGDCPPVGHMLRDWFRDRWVRFHSLPGSKRYADTEEEYAEILRRHRTVLAELCGNGSDHELLVITASWSHGSPRPAEREAEVCRALPAWYWTSVMEEEVEPVWTHLWVSQAGLDSDPLAEFLRLVADDVTAGAIITTAAMSWLYHPYDGGADVIAATTAQRAELRERHSQWLSAHPLGL